VEFDLVVRNGTVIDGTGAPRVHGDVAVAGGRIVAIGVVDGKGAEEIDAEGLVVAPGFVDGHTHMDAQIFWDHLGNSSCWQGVTTVVMGNCGYTLAPVHPDQRALVSNNMERAEDIPAETLSQGVPWTWSTFAEYLDVVDALPKGMNYAQSIGHSALRIWAMGERAFDEPATADDLRVMERELAAALAAGAMGLTTSRNHDHTTADHRLVASRLAEWDEVVALVHAVGRQGDAVFQIGSGELEVAKADHLRRLCDLSVAAGVQMVMPVVNMDIVGMMEAAAADGGEMYGLTQCRGFNVLQSFKTRLSFDTLPSWQTVRDLPLDKQRALFQDPDVRAKLVHAAHHEEYKPVGAADPFEPDFEKIFIMRSAHNVNPSVADEARRGGVDPVELMIDLGLETDFDICFIQSFWDPFARAFYAGEDLDEFRRLLSHPRTAMTFSDAGAHSSQISDASIQTQLIAHWVRERQAFTLEEAIRMITLQPARAWRLHDRGVLAPGYAADITVFDADKVAPRLPKVVNDLPGGARRYVQRADGYVATIVNGTVFTRDGEATEARPGRLLRRGHFADPAA
jgi:N-acyl-D-amino-acid deacylase